MEIGEIRRLCLNAVQRSECPESRPSITFRIPESPSRPKKRSLFGNHGPRGNVVQWGIPEGYDVVIFDAQELIDFIDKNTG